MARGLAAVSGLKNVNAIVSLVKTSFSFNAHGSTFGLDVFTDLLRDEWFGSVGGFSADCKIINLMTD